jgi:hypothetical protein
MTLRVDCQANHIKIPIPAVSVRLCVDWVSNGDWAKNEGTDVSSTETASRKMDALARIRNMEDFGLHRIGLVFGHNKPIRNIAPSQAGKARRR